ncbi:1774_t:CDS:2 [Funneliformis geosporum]|uniref:10920_t:CDS:1 n=1 Tax=Funneliformis geosporum TaxID=1117311 RepID=A0A9W4SY09_9GLOM|nr:10920_t:CDS:2 [Funneliformis geosporum]CAI2184938.1 1774_t:CDS:2 [Funneliformis geosporum]
MRPRQSFRPREESSFQSQDAQNELASCKHELELQKEKMKQELVKEREEYEKTIESLEQLNKKQEKHFHQLLQQTQEKHIKNLNNLQNKLNDKGNGLSELEKENAKLREEASKYQSALGVATNTRLDDDDQNHSVKFKRDILQLQQSLENYVTHLKPNIDIDIEKVRILAQEYGCLNEINVENPNKPFIKAILQRKVLDQVQFLSYILSNYRGSDFSRELDIDIKTKELMRLINSLSKHRDGTDKVIDAAAIKIRQEVYGILGNRGYNDMIDFDVDGTSTTRRHCQISYASIELNKMMNQYRKINDVDKKKKVEAMAPKLVQDIYKLLWFRLSVQEPVAELHFFRKDTKIDSNLMNGIWEDDGDVNQLSVAICYFPLVGRDLESSNRKVYTAAKVFPRAIISSNEINEESEESR